MEMKVLMFMHDRSISVFDREDRAWFDPPRRRSSPLMAERLFDAFPPATRGQWEAVIKKELKDKESSALDVVVD